MIMRILTTSLFLVLFLASPFLVVNYASAQNAEQDKCAPGFVVDSTFSKCIEANSQNDPNDCLGQGGGADAIERCLASSPRPCQLSGSFLGLPTWYKYLDAETDPTGRCSPALSGGDTETRVNSALPIGLAVLEAMIRLAGVVAVVMMFVSGFRFITSEGNPENAAAARKTAINAVIGLVIVVISVNLIAFVGSRLS